MRAAHGDTLARARVGAQMWGGGLIGNRTKHSLPLEKGRLQYKSSNTPCPGHWIGSGETSDLGFPGKKWPNIIENGGFSIPRSSVAWIRISYAWASVQDPGVEALVCREHVLSNPNSVYSEGSQARKRSLATAPLPEHPRVNQDGKPNVATRRGLRETNRRTPPPGTYKGIRLSIRANDMGSRIGNPHKGIGYTAVKRVQNNEGVKGRHWLAKPRFIIRQGIPTKGIRGLKKLFIKSAFMCAPRRMEVNQEQYAGWESGRRSMARIAKAVRDKYLALDKDAVLRACSEVWASEDTGIGMKILCSLVNRLQPERAKEEIYDELCEYQKPSPKRFFSSSDREKFNQYLLRYPPTRTQDLSPAVSIPADKGKESAGQVLFPLKCNLHEQGGKNGPAQFFPPLK